MLQNVNIENILFIDIETVAQHPSYAKVPDDFKVHWAHKTSFIGKENEKAEDSYTRAGIYAEFGKIVCISVGIMYVESEMKNLRVKSFSNDNEHTLITDFFELLNTHYNFSKAFLCAHNGKEFDFPYITRRAMVNGISIPNILDLTGMKPWEINHLDTLQLWKCGDYKHYTSLSLLATIFNIPNHKDVIDGSMVNDIYWKEKNLKKISDYCEKDVIVLSQLFLHFRNEALINPENINII